MKTKEIPERVVSNVCKRLVEEGLLIEAGWFGFTTAIDLEGASELQKSEMRKSFFAGAQHLFSSIMTILDPGSEATDADLKRMSDIHRELENFINKFKEENLQ